MTELLIRHKVGDYETFKKVFLEDQETASLYGQQARACAPERGRS